MGTCRLKPSTSSPVAPSSAWPCAGSSIGRTSRTPATSSPGTSDDLARFSPGTPAWSACVCSALDQRSRALHEPQEGLDARDDFLIVCQSSSSALRATVRPSSSSSVSAPTSPSPTARPLHRAVRRRRSRFAAVIARRGNVVAQRTALAEQRLWRGAGSDVSSSRGAGHRRS